MFCDLLVLAVVLCANAAFASRLGDPKGVSAPSLSKRVNCRTISSVRLNSVVYPEQQHGIEGPSSRITEGVPSTLKLEFLASPGMSCVYDVTSPIWSTKPAVAKYTSWPGSSREAEALFKFGELYYMGPRQDGWRWLVMEKKPGKRVWDIPAWDRVMGANPEDPSPTYLVSNKKGAFHRCEAFMKGFYGKVADAAMDVWSKHGIYHADLHMGNILVTEDEHGDIDEVFLIDWDKWKSKDDFGRHPPTRQTTLEYLLLDSYHPIKDNLTYEGVCRSRRRGASSGCSIS